MEPSKSSRTFTSFDLGEMLQLLARDEKFCARLAPSLDDLLSQYAFENDMTFVAGQVLITVANSLSESYELPRPSCPHCLVINEIFSLKCEINAFVVLFQGILAVHDNLLTSQIKPELSELLEGCSSFLSNIQNHAHSLDLQLDNGEG